MKFHDYNAERGLALVTDDDGSNWRYESLKPRGAAPLEVTPQWLLRQGHYVANAILCGLFIIGSRIPMDPNEWTRKAGR